MIPYIRLSDFESTTQLSIIMAEFLLSLLLPFGSIQPDGQMKVTDDAGDGIILFFILVLLMPTTVTSCTLYRPI